MAANLPKTTQPRWFCGISFTDPNDPSAVEVWQDFTSVLRSVTNLTRGGAVYELGQSTPGQPKFYIRDQAEALNPDNAGGPYSGYILPYRPITWCGTWPQVAGNLLNSGAWRVPFDPSFEASTVGQEPAFVSPVGATSPVVGTTTPRTGSRDLTWTTLAATTIQGVQLSPVYTSPGTQYTASGYVRQSTASTQAIAVGGLTLGADDFNRVTANGWGTATGVNFGGAWTATGGAASDFSTVAGVLSTRGTGLHSLTSANVARMTTIGPNAIDCDVTYISSPPAVAQGAAIRDGAVGRWTAASDFYRASADYNPDQTITFQIFKRVAGVETSLASTTAPFTYNAGDDFYIRLRITGTTLQASMWQVGTARPILDTLTVNNEASITAAGQVGCWSRREVGNVNGIVVMAHQAFNATGTVLGTTTSATGAYNRLTVTFTATATQHPLYVMTQGTALAGTVLLDDIQLEEGASASAFTQTGPVVYPVFNGTCERYERAWTAGGFLGEALITAVDNLAALNAIPLDTEYAVALAATNPAYVWPLNDLNQANTFTEQSGNGGPPLTAVLGKGAGANGTATGGGAMNIVGDPGGSGVVIEGSTDTHRGVTLRSGALNIPSTGASWAVTYAVWVNTTDNTDTFGFVDLTSSFNTNNSNNTALLRSGTADLHPFTGTIYTPAVGGTSTPDAPGTYIDGKPHLFVVTNILTGGNFNSALYVDGVLAASNSASAVAAFGIATPNFGLKYAEIAQGEFGGDTGNGVNGNYSWFAIWRRVLTSGEVANLWTAGGTGFSGERSSTRFVRHLTAGGYTGATRITLGSSLMGPPSYEGTIKLLPDAQNTAIAEGGCLWAAQDGAVVFEGRQARWLRLTPVATFGENVAGGEIAYEPDFSVSQDPQYLFADVKITQANGSTAVGGKAADITTATQRFFGKPYAATVDLLNAADAQSLADWTFYTHNRPLTRTQVLHITPARAVGTAVTAPGTWAQAFSLEIGQRVRATRRASAGNSGSGATVTLDFFIEAVTFDNFVADTGEFDAYFLLSPIGSATSGTGVTFQPWILGDATLGVLGQTTVLGW